jgi:Family of unknown function (DUF6368)
MGRTSDREFIISVPVFKAGVRLPHMAGPVASVLILERTNVAEREVWDLVYAHLEGLGARREGHNFWLNDRPFILKIAAREGDAARQADAELLPELGHTPWLGVELSAMCNSAEDHQLLGELCLAFARQFDGIVDFGGTILPEPSLDGEAALPAVSVPLFFDGRGTLYAASYKIDEGRYGTCHYGDAALMQAWLRQPQFRMVK